MMETTSNITLRQFAPEDWQTFKAIRLEALVKDGWFFGSTYEIESTRTDDMWHNRLSNGGSAIWGLYDGDECIGLTGLYIKADEPDTVMFMASYIRSEYRRKGLSKLYYQTRLAWAREHGFKKARIGHREGNEPSKAANQKFGFRYTHSELMKWPDGTESTDVYYVLEL
jgi:RimJ/RimL family protein N-acetyltransferase